MTLSVPPVAADPQLRVWFPYVSRFDPCLPITEKTYIVPPNVTMPFQPPGLPQFSPYEALKLGTLWPAYYSPYVPTAHK